MPPDVDQGEYIYYMVIIPLFLSIVIYCNERIKTKSFLKLRKWRNRATDLELLLSTLNETVVVTPSTQPRTILYQSRKFCGCQSDKDQLIIPESSVKRQKFIYSCGECKVNK